MSSTKFGYFGQSETKMADLASNWLIHFWPILWNPWTELKETLQEARSQSPLQSLRFRADCKTKMAALAFNLLRHFSLLLWNCWMEFNKTWQEASTQLSTSSSLSACASFQKRYSDARVWPCGPFIVQSHSIFTYTVSFWWINERRNSINFESREQRSSSKQVLLCTGNAHF